MSPAPVSSPTCTHDLGVGTKVCLRCRQEARQAVRAQQQRLLTKVFLAGAALIGVSIVGASTANAWRAASRVNRVAEMPTVVTTAISPADVRPQGKARDVASSAVSSVAATPVASLVAPPVAAPAMIKAAEPASVVPPPQPVTAAPPLALVVPQGRTALKDSVLAERMGDSVIVSFDLVMTRTRRRDKFERIVRATLPAVYGARADSVLAAIPDGRLVGDGDLMTELPSRGIRLPLRGGYTLGVWPETRAGRDGPLVVGYRARVVKG